MQAVRAVEGLVWRVPTGAEVRIYRSWKTPDDVMSKLNRTFAQSPQSIETVGYRSATHVISAWNGCLAAAHTEPWWSELHQILRPLLPGAVGGAGATAQGSSSVVQSATELRHSIPPSRAMEVSGLPKSGWLLSEWLGDDAALTSSPLLCTIRQTCRPADVERIMGRIEPLIELLEPFSYVVNKAAMDRAKSVLQAAREREEKRVLEAKLQLGLGDSFPPVQLPYEGIPPNQRSSDMMCERDSELARWQLRRQQWEDARRRRLAAAQSMSHASGVGARTNPGS